MYNVCEWKWVIMNYKDIENSIIKKFRKTIWVRFVRAINEYNLIEPNDKIMVCISGGKDSMLLAKCIQETYISSIRAKFIIPQFVSSDIKLFLCKSHIRPKIANNSASFNTSAPLYVARYIDIAKKEYSTK